MAISALRGGDAVVKTGGNLRDGNGDRQPRYDPGVITMRVATSMTETALEL